MYAVSAVQCVDIASILRLQNEVNKQSKSEEKLEKWYLRRDIQGKGKYYDLSLEKKKKKRAWEIKPCKYLVPFLEEKQLCDNGIHIAKAAAGIATESQLSSAVCLVGLCFFSICYIMTT